MDVKLASSDAALVDRSPASERRRDLASAGTGADAQVFVTAAPWRAQALRWIGYATGTLTVLWLVALIAGAVGAGRLPAVPFPAIGALHGTQAARKAAQPSLPSGIVDRGPAALGRGSGADSLRRAAAAPAPASVRGGVPRGGGRHAPDRRGSRAPLAGGRHPAASAPSRGSARPAPAGSQTHAATPSPATPSAPSQPVTRGATRTAAKPATPPGRQTAASQAPATSRAADPPATTPTTARRPPTAG